jgi:hypothetical protein
MSSLVKSFYATVGSLLLAERAFAADGCGFFGCDNATGLRGGDDATDPFEAFARVIQQLMTLITIIAVAYVLWAGFQIMTAGGDEERVKKGRQTIIYVIIGIVVMWLAFWIVTFVIRALAG